MKNEELGHQFGIVNNEISKVDILRISLPYPEKMCSDTPWEPLSPTGLDTLFSRIFLYLS